MDAKTETNPEEKLNTDIPMTIKEEELLGSLTISDVPELKGQQLRSSARVFKKMRLDSVVLAVPEKSEKKEESKQESKKCFRPLWSSDDKNLFFEALNEYGKDFENIQLYISSKFRKKGVPDHFIKTKDQIRHLYYRTWQKISKYLKFSEGIKKVTQELYGLINYGELRKKVGSVNEKSLVKLNKLIYKGAIILRVKGKSIKVKTPSCKALRKLNQLDDKYEEVTLPNRLTVELRPKDMASFLKVQSTAQNPRLKTYMPLQKRLSSLIECLSKKWKSIDANIYDKVLLSGSLIKDDGMPPEKEVDACKEKLNPLLRITPPPDIKIEVPSISLGEYFTRQSICFNSYETRLGIQNFNSYTNFKMMNKVTKKGSRVCADSVSDKSEKSPQKSNSHNDEDICDIVADTETSNEASKDTIKGVSAFFKTEVEEVTVEDIKVEEKVVPEVDNTAEMEKQERVNAIKRGWTVIDSESITLGEIYLMFGVNSKLILEYSWDPPVTPKTETTDDTKTEVEDSDVAELSAANLGKKLSLSDSLLQLLSVAKLHYRKNIIKCPCGHVCGAKNNVQLKRDVETKIRKILTDIDKCAEDSEEKEHLYENGTRFVRPPVYIQPKNPLPSYFQANAVHLSSQIDSIQRLTPRYCNRRGRRPRSKQVVVERKLPLLPNNVESGHQIVRMNIISKEEPKFVPTLIEPKAVVTTTNLFIPQVQEPCTSTSTSNLAVRSDLMLAETLKPELDMEPSSPSRILKEAENWINSEVGDYSLSSLLGHLESPMKSGSNIINEDSRMSQDVDAQLHSMMTQNSIDFSANFADLAAEVARDAKCELG
ncbi:protein cramped [Diabrotica undecimpunctata]|uniref:protein cramped n=1 Tax=Diabrotica undecimpunctata TaxID=50387 RepID=UPI003B63BD1F